MAKNKKLYVPYEEDSHCTPEEFYGYNKAFKTKKECKAWLENYGYFLDYWVIEPADPSIDYIVIDQEGNTLECDGVEEDAVVDWCRNPDNDGYGELDNLVAIIDIYIDEDTKQKIFKELAGHIFNKD